MLVVCGNMRGNGLPSEKKKSLAREKPQRTRLSVPGEGSTESSGFPEPGAHPSSSSATFNYQAWGPDNLAPIIPLRLCGPNGAVLTDSGLIDTGADSSAFPLWIMKRFGIRKKDCRKEKFDTSGGKGPGSTVPCVFWRVEQPFPQCLRG